MPRQGETIKPKRLAVLTIYLYIFVRKLKDEKIDAQNANNVSARLRLATLLKVAGSTYGWRREFVLKINYDVEAGRGNGLGLINYLAVSSGLSVFGVLNCRAGFRGGSAQSLWASSDAGRVTRSTLRSPCVCVSYPERVPGWAWCRALWEHLSAEVQRGATLPLSFLQPVTWRLSGGRCYYCLCWSFAEWSVSHFCDSSEKPTQPIVKKRSKYCKSDVVYLIKIFILPSPEPRVLLCKMKSKVTSHRVSGGPDELT